MTAFIAELPLWVYILVIFSFLYIVAALGYLIGVEVGQERGFRLGYARGKLVGTQEANYYFNSGNWPPTDGIVND
jgi:hypothetical protein